MDAQVNKTHDLDIGDCIFFFQFEINLNDQHLFCV